MRIVEGRHADLIGAADAGSDWVRSSPVSMKYPNVYCLLHEQTHKKCLLSANRISRLLHREPIE
jgi:hypothetical protein